MPWQEVQVRGVVVVQIGAAFDPFTAPNVKLPWQ
jgi:hypothetical protein